LEEIEKNGFVLTPGRYVGSDFSKDSNEDFEENMVELISKMRSLGESASRIDNDIEHALTALGFNV
jgi:type I restriction enzyme M protein